MFVRKYFVLLLPMTFVLDSLAVPCGSGPKPLEKICAIKRACDKEVPIFLAKMFDYLRNPVNLTEEMFLREGDRASVFKLVKNMKPNKTVDLTKYGTLEIATGIKRFLRNLPNSLIPHRVAVSMTNFISGNYVNVKRNIRMMPQSHLAVFDKLLDLLHYLVTLPQQEKDKHKMNASKFASAIGENLIPVVELRRAEGQTEGEYAIVLQKEKNKINACLAYLIEYYANDLVC